MFNATSITGANPTAIQGKAQYLAGIRVIEFFGQELYTTDPVATLESGLSYQQDQMTISGATLRLM